MQQQNSSNNNNCNAASSSNLLNQVQWDLEDDLIDEF